MVIRALHMTSWPLWPTELQDAELGPAVIWRRADEHTYEPTGPTWLLWHITKRGQDAYWEGYSLGRGTQADRQTDRQIQKTEPFTTRRRSAPARLFHKWWTVLRYCKVQFCRHTGADHRAYKQVVDNGSRCWLVESLSVGIGGVKDPRTGDH